MANPLHPWPPQTLARPHPDLAGSPAADLSERWPPQSLAGPHPDLLGMPTADFSDRWPPQTLAGPPPDLDGMPAANFSEHRPQNLRQYGAGRPAAKLWRAEALLTRERDIACPA